MKKIFKYELEVTDIQHPKLPLGYEILSAGEQNGKLFIWALVNSKNTPINTTIAIVGTGNPIMFNIDDFTFINTIQCANGLVLHVFHFID